MTVITQEQIDSLARHAAPHSVSIWMPTHVAGRELREDMIRIKNLLTQAEEQLTDLGLRSAEAQKRLQPVREITDDPAFWRQQSAGLGIFISADEPRMLRLPTPAEELVTVGDHFHVKPLFNAVSRDRRFYVLQLSKNTVRFLRAGRFDVETVDLPDAPENFKEFMRFDVHQRHQDWHTGTAMHQPGQDRPAAFHGQGSAAEDSREKKRIMDYCRKIDAEVKGVIGDERAPLVLAATEPLKGIYRQVSACRQLDERSLEGSPDRADPEDLHHQAVELLQEDFDEPVRELLDEYGQARSAGLAAGDLAEVLRAAGVHAVDTLLVALDEQQWGRYDPQAGELERHDKRQPGDEDLLNLAVVLASQGGATVHAVERDRLPEEGPVAARLRFHPKG